jgi:hypothetical protein
MTRNLRTIGKLGLSCLLISTASSCSGRSRSIPWRLTRRAIRRATVRSRPSTSNSLGSGFGAKRRPPHPSSTKTPCTASVWKCTLRFTADPNLWIAVTPGCVTTVGAAPLSALKLSTRVGPPARREPERLAVELGPSLQHEQFSFLGLDNHRLALIPRAARDDARQASGPVRRMVDCSKVPSNITLLCASRWCRLRHRRAAGPLQVVDRLTRGVRSGRGFA